MVQDYKILADEVKDKILDLEVVAINMSKTDFEAAGIEGVPVIRLYKKDGSMVEMKKKAGLQEFEAFIKENGFGM